VSYLAGFSFSVTDAVSGQPIASAHCLLYAGLNNTGDAVGGYTDSSGVCGLDAQWFVPRSWRVSKEGYVAQWGNGVVSQIVVALEGTTVVYTVNVNYGAGGTTTPSGFLQVAPNTELGVEAFPAAGYALDYWVYKGQVAGNTNPTKFLIDRDAITISAVFKVVDVPPPPDGVAWPVTRQIHLFDDYVLKAQSWDFPEKAETRYIKNVDTNVLLGGKLDYTITYLEGNDLFAPHGGLAVNGVTLFDEGFDVGVTKTGSIDLTGYLQNTNEVEIGFATMIGTWALFSFDLYVTLGFSSDPATEPGATEPPPFSDWPWYYWAAIGGGALLLFAVMGRGRSTVVVVGGKKD